MKDLLGSRASEFIPAQQKPDLVNEVMARSYASWMAWWKNTLNTDDYLKYISTQVGEQFQICENMFNSVCLSITAQQMRFERRRAQLNFTSGNTPLLLCLQIASFYSCLSSNIVSFF